MFRWMIGYRLLYVRRKSQKEEEKKEEATQFQAFTGKSYSLRDCDWDKRDITWSPLQEAHQDHCSDGEDNLFSQSWDASIPEWQTSTFYTLERGM